ncbi:MAG: phosphatase PAP2 family protein [Alphaproteobacteria bacterium]|nr:phosphatase PAP2 family protein [Alphaproteobacteria bacterium]
MKKSLLLLTPLMGLLLTNNALAFGGPFSSLEKAGDMMLVMTPAYALGLSVMANDYKGALQLGESVLAAQIASEGIKALEIERRPNKKDKKSFPSGHAVGAFSSAMYVHKRYGLRYAITPYVMSLFTGYTRGRAKAHYWHDVAAGAALSALVTWVLVDDYLPHGTTLSADSESVRVGFNTQF